MSENENIEARLCSYIEGDLDAQGRAEIEKYLLSNPQYRALLQELARTRGLLRNLPRESAPAELMETLSGQIERSALLGDDSAVVGQVGHNRFGQFAAWAAVLVLTGGLAAVVYRVLPSNKVQPELALLKPAPLPSASATPSQDDGAKLAPDMDKVVAAPATEPAAGVAVAQDATTAPAQVEVAAAPTVDAPGAAQPPIDQIAAAASTAPADLQSNAVADSVAPAFGGAAGQVPKAQSREQSREQIGSVVLSGDATQTGRNLFVTLHSADAKAAGARVTAYLADNGIPYEAHSINTDARLSAGPLPPPMLNQGSLNQTVTNAAPTENQMGAFSTQAVRSLQFAQQTVATTSPGFASQSPLAKDQPSVIIARDLTLDQAQRLASAFNVQPPPVQPAPAIMPTTQAVAAKLGAVTGEQPLQIGQSVHIVAHEKLLPDVEAMDETQAIDPAGNLTLPQLGKVQAVGNTPSQLATRVAQAYRAANSPTEATWTIQPIAQMGSATQPTGNVAFAASQPSVLALAPATQPTGLEVPAGRIDVTIQLAAPVSTTTAPAMSIESAGAATQPVPASPPATMPSPTTLP
jgi:hypothetical protein